MTLDYLQWRIGRFLNWLRYRRPVRRDTCRHEWVGTALPEETRGLYAFSKMQCRVCGYCDPYFSETGA